MVKVVEYNALNVQVLLVQYSVCTWSAGPVFSVYTLNMFYNMLVRCILYMLYCSRKTLVSFILIRRL